jgi:protein involved in polysaccharide export with SLBB domain
MQEDMVDRTSLQKLSQSNSLPLGNAIEAEYYHIGPGDMLSVLNLMESAQPKLLTVTPENSVIMPRIGEISLKNMTLAEARQIILKKLNEKNPASESFVALFSPRLVLVTVNGNIMFPGTYPLPATYKVSAAILNANMIQGSAGMSAKQGEMIFKLQMKQNENEKNFSGSGFAYFSTYATRNILVTHSDGTSTRVDIEKARYNNIVSLDPYLRDGDIIYVPFDENDYPVISISGAVQKPNRFAYKPGDKVSMLLKSGFGTITDSDLDNVYLYQNGDERVKLRIDSNLTLLDADRELIPGSFIVVGSNYHPVIKKQGLVTVSGFVRQPGVYPIQNGESRLKDVIAMAKGFTDDAYLPLSYILRRQNETPTLQYYENEVFEKFQYSDLTLQDTVRFTIDQILRRQLVSCDFRSAFVDNSEMDNVKLMDGDRIYIPTNPKTIYIFGQVNKPGFISYEPGKNMDWYIEKAGGYATGADKGRSRIIKGRNRVWVEGKPDIALDAGDEIYIPRYPDLPPGMQLQTYSVIAGVLASAAVLLSVVIGLIK